MATKTLLSLATVSLLAFAAKAYTVETTNSWFSVKASEDLDTSKWSGATPTKEEDAKVIDVDTGANNPALYTMPALSKPSATRYRVKGNMTVTLNAGVPANDVFGETTLPKAALVAASVGGVNKWYAWHLKSASAGEWVAMTEHTPEENATYAVAIELTDTTVSYKVGGIQLLTAEGSETTLSTIGGKSLSKVGLAGYGSFGDFGALGFDSFEVTIAADKVDDVKDAMGIADISAAELNKKGANGLTKWESIVLGLPDSSTKPYTAPVQTNNGNLGFTIGAAEIGKYSASGANVTVEVYSSDTANGEFTSVANQTQGSSSNQYTATVEPDSDGVKYYKIKISIANP